MAKGKDHAIAWQCFKLIKLVLVINESREITQPNQHQSASSQADRCPSKPFKQLSWRSSVTVCTFWKVLPTFFKFVVCNPCQSSPSLTILVPLSFIIISLMFFYLSKLLFSGFLPFKGDFLRGKKKKDKAPWLSSFKPQIWKVYWSFWN